MDFKDSDDQAQLAPALANSTDTGQLGALHETVYQSPSASQAPVPAGSTHGSNKIAPFDPQPQRDQDFSNIPAPIVTQDRAQAPPSQSVRPSNQQDGNYVEGEAANSEREFIEKAERKSSSASAATQLDNKNAEKKVVARMPDEGKDESNTTFNMDPMDLIRRLGGVFNCHGDEYIFSKTSLFCLSDQNFLRKALVWLSTWKWFDAFITLSIILNSFMLASTDYEIRLNPNYVSSWTPTQDKIDTVFSIIFITEASVKILAMGFVLHKYSYLREAWNCLDFFIVLVSIVGMLPLSDAASSLKILRTFRILRPLRSINKLPSVKQQINSVLSSIPGLMRVFFFIIFIFSIFAIFGTNQFLGQQYQFCRDGPDATLDKDGEFVEWAKLEGPVLCTTNADCLFLFPEKGDNAICGTVFETFGKEPYEFDGIRDIDTIMYGIPGFDNVFQGFLTIFQILTLESWVYLMYNFGDTGSVEISVIFFVLVVLLGAFFTMNLVLAIIVDAFNEAAQKAAGVDEEDEDDDEEELEEQEQEDSDDKRGKPSPVEEEKENAQNEVKNIEMQLISDVSSFSRPPSILPDIGSGKFNEQAAREQLKIERSQGIVGMSDLTENDPMDRRTSHPLALVAQPATTKGTQEFRNGIDPTNDRQNNMEFVKQVAAISQPVIDAQQSGTGQDAADVSHDPFEVSEYEENDPEKDARTRSRRNGFFRCTYLLVTSVSFNFFIFILIIANTITLACYTYDESQAQIDVMNIFNEIFTWTFFMEMVLKIIGLGFKNYRQDSYNVFDAVIVIISLVDWTVSKIPDLNAGSALNAFRAMRLLRMMKLSKSWKALSAILVTTGKSLKDISQFSILLILFMYIFALLGMELFANMALVDGDENLIYGEEKVHALYASDAYYTFPRDNWNNVGFALTTVFILIIGEDWNWTMYTWVRAYGAGSGIAEFIAIFFFIFLMVIGNIVLFSVFTAILLQNFEGGGDEGGDESDEEEEVGPQNTEGEPEGKSFAQRNCSKECFGRFSEGFKQAFGGKVRKTKHAEVEKEEEEKKPTIIEPIAENKEDASANASASDVFESEQSQSLQSSQEQLQRRAARAERRQKRAAKQRKMSTRNQSHLMHYDTDSTKFQRVSTLQLTQSDDVLVTMPLTGVSLFCLQPANGIRILCHRLVQNWWFEKIILTLICISTITLALETPLDNPKGDKIRILGYIDLFMTVSFTFEAVVKIIAAGFLLAGKDSYIRQPWNILDFVIVFSALLGIIAGDAIQISFIKALRILKILRPLRIISTNKDLKVAIMSLGGSIPSIVSLQVIVLFFVFLFAILQTTILSGQFYSCELNHVQLNPKQSEQNIKTMWDCYNYGGEWVEPRLNFDTTIASMLTLLTIQTTEGWIDVMWSSVDAVNPYYQPQVNNSPLMILYTMILIIFICMLFMELFVGVVIETFNSQKELLSCNSMLTRKQFSWITIQLINMNLKPQRKLEAQGNNRIIRNWCIHLTEHRYFDLFIMSCIMGNTFILGFNWYMQPESYKTPIDVINYIFMVIFTIEAITKIIAQKKDYFRDSWNIFDFTVVAGTIVILVLNWAGIGDSIAILGTILRTLRIGRVFRLIKKQQKLQQIFKTLMSAVPAMASLGMLLMLLIFMFSIIGMAQFAVVDLDDAAEMGRHVNFQSFGSAFLTLIRCSTGEAWNSIMFDSSREFSIMYQCNQGEDYESIIAAGRDPATTYGPKGCGTGFAIVFHLLFQIIVSQVFLNLFIAIIIDAFFGQANNGELWDKFQDRALEGFQRGWADYDKAATGYITTKELESFIIDLASEKYDIASNLIPDKKFVATDADFRATFIMDLQIPTYDKMQRVMFYDVLMKLSHKIVRNHYESAANKKMRKSLSALMLQNKVDCDSDHFKAELDTQFKQVKQNSYDKEIDQIAEMLKGKNPVAELVRELNNQNKKFTTKYNHIVDTNVKMLGEAYFTQKISEGYDIPVEIYSTSHSRSCKVIYALIDKHLDKKKAAAANSNMLNSQREASPDQFIRNDQ